MNEFTNISQFETIPILKIDFPRFDQVFDQAKNWWSEQREIGQRNVDKRIKEAGLWVQQRQQEWLGAFQEISELPRKERIDFFKKKLSCSEKTAADLAVLAETTPDGILSRKQKIAVKDLSQTMASVANQPASQSGIESFLLATAANGQDLSVAPSDDVPAWLKDENQSVTTKPPESSSLEPPPPESIPPKKKSSKKEKQAVPIDQIPLKERTNRWGLVNTGVPIAAGILILCLGAYLTIGRFTEEAAQKASGSQNLPEEYQKIRNADPYLVDLIQKARNSGLGKTEGQDQKTDTLAYGVIGEYNNALIYLQGGSKEQWDALGRELEEGDINSTLGQHAALNKAGCLIRGRLDKQSCIKGNTANGNPGFANAGDQYIQKYNAAMERLKPRINQIQTLPKFARSSYRPKG